MISLNELTIEDLKDIEELQSIRKEAERLYNIVVGNQKVPLILDNKNRYCLWHDEHNATYLAFIDGEWIWQARYLHQTYDVPINAEKIYQMMVAAYEWKKDKSKNGICNKNKEAIEYFRSYVSDLNS